MKKVIVTLICSISFSSVVTAQAKLAETRPTCQDFHLEVGLDRLDELNDSLENEDSYIDDINWKLDQQSRSAKFGEGDTSSIHMIAYADQEYRVFVFNEEGLGEGINFKIYEKITEIVNPEEEAKKEQERQDSIAAAKKDSMASDTATNMEQAGIEPSMDAYADPYSDSYEEAYAPSLEELGLAPSSSATTEYVEDMQQNRIKYRKYKELLYDNQEDGGASTVKFFAKNSMSLIIEIIAPGEQAENKFKMAKTGCVGVLVHHARISDKGF